MNLYNFFSGSRVFLMFWIAISLGSCSLTHIVDNSAIYYTNTLSTDSETVTCKEFTRMVRIGHHRPTLPKVDIRKLSQDERADLLLSYMEKLKTYLDNEERYLAEDIVKHRETCTKPDLVFQK